MKKKSHKTTGRRKQSPSTFQIVIIISLIFALIASGKIISGISKTHVLGASTVLLADKGSDDGGGHNSGRSDNSGGGGSNSGSSVNPSNGTSGNNSIGSVPTANTTNAIAPNTKVDCVGPDGRHFTTEFHDCQELNQNWNRTNFNFTPLSTTTLSAPKIENEAEVKPTIEKKTNQIQVQTEGSKKEVNLESQGLHVEIKREDNGQLVIKAKEEDGQEVKLEDSALSHINDTLKGQEVEVSTTSANKLAITSHNVSAHTTLPLSIDPSSNTLAITTPGGTKDVTVLPNQAVQSLLTSKILSNVLSSSSTQATGSANATTVIGLTTVNNQPVFEIQGVKEKHLLGIFPVAFQKTVVLSAQNGQVIDTQENTINKILESLSL